MSSLLYCGVHPHKYGYPDDTLVKDGFFIKLNLFGVSPFSSQTLSIYTVPIPSNKPTLVYNFAVFAGIVIVEVRIFQLLSVEVISALLDSAKVFPLLSTATNLIDTVPADSSLSMLTYPETVYVSP